jgi:zinc protease
VLEAEGLPRGLLGWHTVPQSDPDKPALDVLSDILCCGRRSRLWHRLVEQDRLATWVDASHESARLGGQLLIQLEAPERRNFEHIEAVIHDELQKLAHHGPTEREMARSRARLDASWRWDKEDVLGIAAGIGQAGLWGDWRAWLAEHQRAMSLDTAQIARVAQIYLRPNQVTVAWSIPERGRDTQRISTVSWHAREVAVAANGHVSGRLDPRLPWQPVPSLARARELATLKPHRTVLSNGLILLVEPRPGTGTVAIELHLDAGQIRERKPGLAALVGRMLEDGTRHRTAETLASEVEDAGGVLEAGSTGASLRFRREDLPLALELLADVITRPRFPADRLDWQQRRMIAEWRADRDEPSLRADAEFRRLVYRNHPYGRDPRGSAADVRRLTLGDIRDHHRKWFHARGAILAIAGDVEPQAVLTLVRKHMGAWRPAGTIPRSRQEAPSLIPPRRRHIRGASVQTQIILGHLGVRRADPAHDALLIVDHILGSGPGCADRLSRVLRDELALVYSVHGGITDSADLEPGLFRVTLGTPPSESQAANDRARELIAEVAAGRFSDNEIAEAKTYLEGAWVFDYQTTGQSAERLLELERLGLPLDLPSRWPDQIHRITPAEVRNAARTHLRPERLIEVTIGTG